MVVGTGSHVGKSVLAAGLCRIYRRRGVDVAPFKAQNMALNSGITPDGGEMGRAQITQAEAAGVTPHTDMNPILLKPTSDLGSQVILEGRAIGNYKGREYYALKPRLVRRVMACWRRLAAAHQLIVMEGAGSCAEVNLQKHDIVNLPMARRVGAKAILAADIDAGGVFAQVVGTLRLLPPSQRRLVCGVVINKFRGDAGLFADGVEYLERKTGLPVLGVLPRFTDILLPQEDGVALERGGAAAGAGAVRVGVVRLGRISNFTDADALSAHPGVSLRWVSGPQELAGLDLVVLPGTKNTLAALAGLRESGLFAGLRSFHALGGRILGLCGGYQLLGRRISDPLGVEGPPGEARGLDLLPVETEMAGEKTTTRVQAGCRPELPFGVEGPCAGYEIHMGRTTALGQDRPAFVLEARLGRPCGQAEGQVSGDGRVVGTYLHGILDNDALRSAVLAWAAGAAAGREVFDFGAFKDRQYDLLADLMEEHLDLEGLLEPL